MVALWFVRIWRSSNALATSDQYLLNAPRLGSNPSPLAEHTLQRLGLDARVEMAIPPPLLVRLMANPFIDQALVDPTAGTG